MIVAGQREPEDGANPAPVYDQMPGPEVGYISMGVCASSAECSTTTRSSRASTDHIVPVDIYLSGCPPRPEMLPDAIIKLHNQDPAHQDRQGPHHFDAWTA